MYDVTDMGKQTACAPTTLSPNVTSSPYLTTEVKPTVWQNNSTSDPHGLTTAKPSSVNETLSQPPTTTGRPASTNEPLSQPPTTGQLVSGNETPPQITEQFHTTTKPESQTQSLCPVKNATRQPTISQPVTLVPSKLVHIFK